MTLRLMPVSCITTSAVSTDSGIDTAATSVERRLPRNRKIVRIANSAPRPPSRTRPSCDSSMNDDRSDTVVMVTIPAFSASNSSSCSSTARATETVFAADVLVTVRVRLGSPFVRE